MDNLAPKGKLLLIGSEDVEVWPNHCVDGHRCIQCWFNGKIRCAPRWWFYPPVYLAPLPAQKPNYIKTVSLEALLGEDGRTLGDTIPAQPLVPLNDGGFTEEITNTVKPRHKYRSYALIRVTDETCLKCGYPCLLYRGFSMQSKRNRYKCPKCGAVQTQGSSRKPEAIKPYLQELWEEGITKKEIIVRIQSRYGIKVSMGGLRKMVKRMGLTPRGHGH